MQQQLAIKVELLDAILGLEVGRLAPGAPADLIVLDPEMPWVLQDAEALLSRSKNTPFEGARFEGRVLRTLVAGRTVYAYAPA